MSTMLNCGRAAAIALTALASTALLADGSGTLNDETLDLAYSAGPFVIPNVTNSAGEPVCEPGTPVCDVYTLAVEFSDELRAVEANGSALIDIYLTWPNALADFDMYLYDSAGTLISAKEAAQGVPELISVPLELMPNGTYSVIVIPWLPVGDAFELSVTAVDIEQPSAKSGIIGGAGSLSTLALLPLALLGLRRRISRR